jgi:hypothetical protein
MSVVALTKDIQICFEWQMVTDSQHDDWPFERKARLQLELSRAFKGPRIYRFLFPDSSIPQAYVGETENFCIRYRHYRCKVPTNRKSASIPTSQGSYENAWRRFQRYPGLRVTGAMENARRDGQIAELQFLLVKSFSSYRACFDQSSLSDLFVRHTEAEGFRVMNRGRDVDTNKKWFSDKLRLRDEELLRRHREGS